jgi:hypothetical protein
MNLELKWNEPRLELIPVGHTRSWKVEYQSAKGMVVVTSHGYFFGEDARRQAEQVSALMQRHKVKRVLADFGAAFVEVSLTDIYWLPAHYSSLTASRRFRLAVVVPASGYRMDSFKFYELRCRNAGFNVKLFPDQAAAEDWLQQTSVS